jgi:hypothetical protein
MRGDHHHMKTAKHRARASAIAPMKNPDVARRNGLARRKPDDKITYSMAHSRVDEAKGGKTGICQECNQERFTNWAFLGPNGKWSTNPDDYEELCIPCHRRLDFLKERVA